MERIQRKRTAGWRMPEDGVYAGRGSAYGNPFAIVKIKERQYNNPYYCIKLVIINELSLQIYQTIDLNQYFEPNQVKKVAVKLYEKYIKLDHQEAGNNSILSKMRRELPGKKIVCWCPLDQPCHVDIIIKLINNHE